MYTFKIEQAIRAAALLHQDQHRKGVVALPYITHLMSVALLLRDYTTDEDTLVAALLHDTLEDTIYTPDELTEDFGPTVTHLVKTVSEPRAKDGESLPWLERKQRYAQQLLHGPIEAAKIAAADKIHNFRCIIEEYHDDPERFVADFGQHHVDRLTGYQAIADAINDRLSDGIVEEFNHTFDLYKQFLLDVQET